MVAEAESLLETALILEEEDEEDEKVLLPLLEESGNGE